MAKQINYTYTDEEFNTWCESAMRLTKLAYPDADPTNLTDKQNDAYIEFINRSIDRNARRVAVDVEES